MSINANKNDGRGIVNAGKMMGGGLSEVVK